jgi:antitoxin HicB
MKTKTKSLKLEDYLKLVYPITLYPEIEGGYTIEIKDLPGCITQGETLEEALEMIEDAKYAWIKVNLELNNPIPVPSAAKKYSGRFVVRLPSNLHQHLAEEAERNGVSLNQMVATLLAERKGIKEARA